MTESTSDFLAALSKRGVKLWTEGGQLRFQAPKGTIMPEELSKLRKLKAEIIELMEQVKSLSDVPLKPRAPSCPVPLTAVQRRCWNYFNEHKKSSWRMCATADRVRGVLDTSLLRSCIEAAVRRHESLRTRFAAVDGIPWQQIDTACNHPLEVIDVSRLTAADIEEHAKRLAYEFVEEKIDLAIGPLFGARLFRLSRHEHVLVLASDHMISDGVSTGILKREVWSLYEQAQLGLPFSLSDLPVQFADYAVWQDQTHSSWRKQHEAYWKRRLSGVPLLQLPTDNGLATAENPVGVWLDVPFGDKLSAGLRDVARRERMFLAIVILAVYVAVLSRWCDQRDFVVLFFANGRNRPELEGMIGFLTEFLHLRVEISGDECLLDVLQRVNHEFQAACEHQDFGRVPDFVPECKEEIYFNWVSPSRRPVDIGQETGNGIRVDPVPFVRKAIPARFGSFFFDSPAGISWSVEYRPDLFSVSTVQRVGSNLRLFAEELVHNPHSRLVAIPMQH